MWSRIRSDPVSCRGQQCKYFGRCFLRAAREKLHEADIAVVNHALFFSDLAIPVESRLLGRYDSVVLDEAHTVESVATTHFGTSINNMMVSFLLRELYNDETDRGLLAMMQAKEAIEKIRNAASVSESFFDELAGNIEGISSSGRITKAEIVPDTITGVLRDVAAEIRRLESGRLSDDNRFELASMEQRIMTTIDTLRGLILQSRDQCAYWRTIHQTRGRNSRRVVTLASAPVNVSAILREMLFDEVPSVVLTSATLSTSYGQEHGFEYIRNRLGIDECDELLLSGPFDYRTQAKLYIETSLGNPNRIDDFAPPASEAIMYYAGKSDGRCFVLTTSYRMIEALAERLENWAYENDYELLVQGEDRQRTAMLEYFRENSRCILVGTTSFWQGVDVPGDALTNVIITKLPFSVPDSPIIESRADHVAAEGGNPFMDLHLPEAVIMFKQGFGRLIRSSTDRGFVVVLDHRILTKTYGRSFIEALPDIEIVRDEFVRNRA